MASWIQIKEGLGQINSQLTAGKSVTAEILPNVIGYLAAIADMGNRIENDCTKMNKQMIEEFSDYSKKMIAEVKEVKQKVMVHQ